jgi:drug/metabolite transporter (DMT)-like permease
VVVAMVLGALLLDERITPRQAFGSVLTIAGVAGVIVTARPPRMRE